MVFPTLCNRVSCNMQNSYCTHMWRSTVTPRCHYFNSARNYRTISIFSVLAVKGNNIDNSERRVTTNLINFTYKCCVLHKLYTRLINIHKTVNTNIQPWVTLQWTIEILNLISSSNQPITFLLQIYNSKRFSHLLR